MPDTAEIAVTGAAAGGFHHFHVPVHDVVAPGQAPPVANGQLESGQIQQIAFGIMDETSSFL